MPRELVTYRWTCPLCSETKTGLATVETMSVEDKAACALMSHVRSRVGSGHGRAGEYPQDFDPDGFLDCIEVNDTDSEIHREAKH